MRAADVTTRAMRHAALGDPARLAIIDELTVSDMAPGELQARFDLPSNLLAHHLDVLERAGLISRHRSSGDGRRRYVQLVPGAFAGLTPRPTVVARHVLFVCTHNSARSPLAAALWRQATGQPARSAGTDPAGKVHPGAVAAARRVGLDVASVVPRRLDAVTEPHDLVVTVCDRAHEEVGGPDWLHWSVADPVEAGASRAFDVARDELARRVETLAGTAATR